MAWFPSQIETSPFTWFVPSIEALILLIVVAYASVIWRLNTKEMKEYFSVPPVPEK